MDCHKIIMKKFRLICIVCFILAATLSCQDNAPVSEDKPLLTDEYLTQETPPAAVAGECTANEECETGYVCTEGKCVAASEPVPEPQPQPEPALEPPPAPSSQPEACGKEGFSAVPPYSDTDPHVHHVSASYVGKGDGSEANPWKTISEAAGHTLQPGDIVIVHAGTYRETVNIKGHGTPDKPIYFLAEDGVFIKGSDVIKGWEKTSGSAIYSHNGWQYKMPWLPTPGSAGGDINNVLEIGKAKAAYDKFGNDWNAKINFLKTSYPDKLYSLMRGQVFVDKEPLKEVTDKTKLSAGTFYIDPQTKRLDVWLMDSSDPAKHVMEGSTRNGLVIFSNDSQHVVFRGFRIGHSTSPLRTLEPVEIGASYSVVIAGQGNRFEGNEIKYVNGSGLNISETSDHKLYKNTVMFSGHVGISSYKASNIVFECNTTAFNGWRTRYLKDNWEHGGMKLCGAKDLTISGHSAYYNVRNGIWFDSECYSNKVMNSTVHGHNGAGIDLENCVSTIDSGNLVSDNIVYSNKHGIVYNNDTIFTKITNNLFTYNFYSGLSASIGSKNEKTNDVSRNIITNNGMRGITYNVWGDNTEFADNLFYKGGFEDFKTRFENEVKEIENIPAPAFIRNELKNELWGGNKFIIEGNINDSSKWSPPIGERFKFQAKDLASWRNMTDIYSSKKQPKAAQQFSVIINGDTYYYKGTVADLDPVLQAGEAKWNILPDTNSLAGDPLYSDPAAADFKLKTESPAIVGGIGPAELRKETEE